MPVIEATTDKRTELVAEISRTEREMTSARVAYDRAVRALEAHDLDRASTEGQTIETALALDSNLSENQIGLKYLKERLANDWSESYLDFPGSMLVNSHQWCVTVGIPHDAPMERIRATAAAIEEIIPFVQPGASASVGKPHFVNIQAIYIRTDDVSGMRNWALGHRDGEWFIFDGKRYSFEPLYTGDLLGALCVIAKQYPRNL